jgi:hypothetical protein
VVENDKATISVDRGTLLASLIEGLEKLYGLEGSDVAYTEVLKELANLDGFVWDMVDMVEEG